MQYVDSRRMPTPLLAIVSIISNILFTMVGGFWMYAWTELDSPDTKIPLYSIIILTTCFITLIIIGYVILRCTFNKYIYTVQLRTFAQFKEDTIF